MDKELKKELEDFCSDVLLRKQIINLEQLVKEEQKVIENQFDAIQRLKKALPVLEELCRNKDLVLSVYGETTGDDSFLFLFFIVYFLMQRVEELEKKVANHIA